MRYLFATKLLFLVSSLLTIYLYQEVHKLSDQQSMITLLEIPAEEPAIALNTSKGTLGNLKLVTEENTYYLQGMINVSDGEQESKALTTINASFDNDGSLNSTFINLKTGNTQISIDAKANRSPNTVLMLRSASKRHSKELELPLKIILHKDSIDRHKVLYHQNSPLIKEIFSTLLKFVLETDSIKIGKEVDGATRTDHLRFDKLASFIQGELFSVLNQKGIGTND